MTTAHHRLQRRPLPIVSGPTALGRTQALSLATPLHPAFAGSNRPLARPQARSSDQLLIAPRHSAQMGRPRIFNLDTSAGVGARRVRWQGSLPSRGWVDSVLTSPRPTRRTICSRTDRARRPRVEQAGLATSFGGSSRRTRRANARPENCERSTPSSGRKAPCLSLASQNSIRKITMDIPQHLFIVATSTALLEDLRSPPASLSVPRHRWPSPATHLGRLLPSAKDSGRIGRSGTCKRILQARAWLDNGKGAPLRVWSDGVDSREIRLAWGRVVDGRRWTCARPPPSDSRPPHRCSQV